MRIKTVILTILEDSHPQVIAPTKSAATNSSIDGEVNTAVNENLITTTCASGIPVSLIALPVVRTKGRGGATRGHPRGRGGGAVQGRGRRRQPSLDTTYDQEPLCTKKCQCCKVYAGHYSTTCPLNPNRSHAAIIKFPSRGRGRRRGRGPGQGGTRKRGRPKVHINEEDARDDEEEEFEEEEYDEEDYEEEQYEEHNDEEQVDEESTTRRGRGREAIVGSRKSARLAMISELDEEENQHIIPDDAARGRGRGVTRKRARH